MATATPGTQQRIKCPICGKTFLRPLGSFALNEHVDPRTRLRCIGSTMTGLYAGIK